MRLALLLLPLLVRGLGGGYVLFAQNGVTVSNLAISSGTVTFDVGWKNTSMPIPWSDTVWVFVDYNDNGVMKRLPLLPGATLTATSAAGVGKAITVPGNNDGVWVVGNARSASAGSFSASVKLLTTATNVAGACVYVSNYPPVGVFVYEKGIYFTGTPDYKLEFIKDGRNTPGWLVSAGSYTVPDSYTLISFSDKTGAPGRIITHAVYCFPGVIGGSGDMDPNCASYVSGTIGGQDDALPDCAAYRAGSIGGNNDVLPDCAGYRAGSIGGVSFVSSNCESYVAGIVGGSSDMAPVCAGYRSGTIGGQDDALPGCASYRAGSIGGRDDVSPSCAGYRAGSIGGVSFAGLM
jgi:hypothetical protein